VFIGVLLMVAASLLHQWWRDWFKMTGRSPTRNFVG